MKSLLILYIINSPVGSWAFWVMELMEFLQQTIWVDSLDQPHHSLQGRLCCQMNVLQIWELVIRGWVVASDRCEMDELI